ncbi:MAG TPA: heme o synthase [Candidatus Acidoferrales bacterium]|nr:heme o synthase [Candidatus Acidoferrales bacterium]
MGTVRATLALSGTRPAAYWALAKPDVTFLVVLTTALGYFAGSRGPLDYIALIHVTLATLLLSAGTAALNQYVERAPDALMRRTAARPLPAGILSPREALIFSVSLAITGLVWLFFLVNPLAGLLGAASCITYLALYTPLKTRTPWCTFVGAFPGAVPPLIGWAAARNSLGPEAWLLFAILFVWQFPHFLAIAWIYREDYARAGIRMLPVVDPSGRSTFRQIVGYSAVLIPVSILPSVAGAAGPRYLFGALVLGLALLVMSLWVAREQTNRSAMWLMHSTVVYIPVLLALLVFDKIAG